MFCKIKQTDGGNVGVYCNEGVVDSLFCNSSRMMDTTDQVFSAVVTGGSGSNLGIVDEVS